MSVPVLATKLYIPPPPAKAVLRSRLLERLNEGLHHKLTLIAAPAGSGKTTLLSAWVAALQARDQQDLRVAWLSLDEEDSDPARFLIYLVSALRKVAPNLGEEVLNVLESSGSLQPSEIEPLLTALLNEISTLPDNFALVLDDYHVIDSRVIDGGLTFLLEHLPQQMRLVITGREDPQLPLARLRARGQLTELRAADLRFSSSEAADFLLAMGLDLSEEDIEALEKRTEGWIAGLQLAALSMRGHQEQDIPTFIRAFAGDHRYIVDYLVEEVLLHQSEKVRRFLLQTSILDRLNGSLCDAVTRHEGGRAQLEALHRGNLFVVPLDDKRQWYRYHHLFGEVLHAHLMAEMGGAEEQPDQVATLHRRASDWYEHNGFTEDAIRHALAARDFERAADLVELAVPAARRSRQDAILLGWLKVLPDEVVHYRPALNVWYAHALLAGGELEGVEDRLRDAERWMEALDTPAGVGARPGSQASPTRKAELLGGHGSPGRAGEGHGGMVVVDKEAFRELPGAIAIARAGQAMALGDIAGVITYARRVLDLVSEEDHFSRGGAEAFLGLASWLRGDLEEAYRSFANGMAHLQRAGHTSDAVNGEITLANIRIAQGRLHEAMRVYKRGLQLAADKGDPAMRGTADMYVGMSEILRERNDLDAAMQHVLKSKELGEHTRFPQNRYRWHVAMSGILEAQGDVDGALEALSEAERVYVRGLLPNLRPVAALKARIWIRQSTQGSLDEAIAWAREQGLSPEDELSYLREFEHITLARMLLALHKAGPNERGGHALSEAVGLLDRLLKVAEEGGRTGRVIEILVLLSLARQAQGDLPTALASLERALALAEPEGYIRIFVDEGPSMAVLLEEAAKRGIAPSYVARLLAAGSWASLNSGQTQDRRREDSRSGKPIKQDLLEPLSERELEVLRLLRSDLSGPEIARALTVSLNTMHTHTKNIYTKLGVNNRRAALRRAEELHLL